MENLRTRVDLLFGQRELIERRAASAEKDLAAARLLQTDIDAVQATLQYTATSVQNGFGTYVGALVTKALHHVFPERKNDLFAVRFRENRGKTECELLLVTAKGEAAHPYDCAGGGLCDVLAFALRASMLVLEQPAPARFLALDEPFKFLHGAVARRKALNMMYNTAKTLGISMFVVHQSDATSDDESLFEIAALPGVHAYEVRKIGYEQCEVARVK